MLRKNRRLSIYLTRTVLLSKGFFPKEFLSILELTYAEFFITHFYARQWPLHWTSWAGAGTLVASYWACFVKHYPRPRLLSPDDCKYIIIYASNYTVISLHKSGQCLTSKNMSFEEIIPTWKSKEKKMSTAVVNKLIKRCKPRENEKKIEIG